MSIMDNWCPAGEPQMRRHFAPTGEISKEVSGRQFATCATCGQPGITVRRKDGLFSKHRASHKTDTATTAKKGIRPPRGVRATTNRIAVE